MLDELRVVFRVPAFAQASELFSADIAAQAPLLREPALPLAMPMLVTAPVVLFLRRELSRMICAGLVGRQRFGESQHA